MQPSVSVIIPTFNRPARLRECLQAMARQIFSAFEIVIVNDGGIPVEPVVADFSGLATRLVNQAARGGHAAARNRGVESAAGKYIALCDDDDL